MTKNLRKKKKKKEVDISDFYMGKVLEWIYPITIHEGKKKTVMLSKYKLRPL